MDIRKVAVLGAGAVGSYVIWGLSARRDIELGVVADGPRGERLAKEGCAINGKVYRPAVWTPGQAHDADLLIVCLKYGALPGALDSIKAVTGPHTTIMSLMNGVDLSLIHIYHYRAYSVLHRHQPQDRRGSRRRRYHGLDGPGAGAWYHHHLRSYHLLLEPL